MVEQADAWRQVAATPAALPAVQPEVDTYASAGHLSVSLDAETTRLLLGEVPAAFHAGVQDILLIAFGLAWAEFLGSGGAPIGIDVEGHGRNEDLAPDVDLSRTVGWFTTKYPVALTVGGLRWAQVVAGDAALGPVIKNAKEQLRALPDGLTYGLLRYLNTDVDLAGPDPTIGFNYLGRLGAAAAEMSDDLWRISQDGLSVADCRRGGAHAAGPHRGAQRRHRRHRHRPAPARRLDLGALGTGSRADQPAEPVVVRRPGRHLRPRPTRRRRADPLRHRPCPAEPTADRRTAAAIPDRRRPAADPPAAGTALPRQHRYGTNDDDVYAMQLDITVTGPLDPHRLRDAVHTVVNRHPNLAARLLRTIRPAGADHPGRPRGARGGISSWTRRRRCR